MSKALYCNERVICDICNSFIVFITVCTYRLVIISIDLPRQLTLHPENPRQRPRQIFFVCNHLIYNGNARPANELAISTSSN